MYIKKIESRLIKTICFSFIFIILLSSCNNNLPVIEDFSHENFSLINQSEEKINFPSNFKGKIIIVGYIFTNCPDICPLTTNNMRLIQEKLKKEKINEVELVSISFDPLQDTPEVLKNFAEIRNLDLQNWQFLTGEKKVIDSLIKKAEVFVIPGDSTILKDGRKIYYYIHTDRIQLFDKLGRVRKNYVGSKVNIEEIINDIKNL
ncbi:MAG: SCO family protein [Melioribacter sp.]|uniref:SCO family protein n=1 Tax=Rosettibacter primus TaxID=3111523 RepID=UPI00247B8C71|nr:SCO family protein [Melioribacter sp.]